MLSSVLDTCCSGESGVFYPVLRSIRVNPPAVYTESLGEAGELPCLGVAWWRGAVSYDCSSVVNG